jgi:hypothetical protein
MKYIMIAFTFYACNFSRETPPISTIPVDTLKTVPARLNTQPDLFETAFIPGTTQKIKDKTFALYGINIGNLKISSGRVVACDPMHIDEYGIPFTQQFPNGEFPVQLSITKVDNREMTAFARILFSNEPVVRWEFALQKDQKPMPIGGEDAYDYCVDAGVGIFIDEQASKVLDRKAVDDMSGAVFIDMEKNYRDKWKYTMYNFAQHNVAAFSTGRGDGCYSTYIGFDATGNPCRLLTDFEIFDWKNKKG